MLKLDVAVGVDSVLLLQINEAECAITSHNDKGEYEDVESE